MSTKRCPNCHADLVGNKCPSCKMSWKTHSDWVCKECGAEYYYGDGGGPMRFCPTCAAVAADKVVKYWEEKQQGMRSVASDVVAKILVEAKNK